MGQSSPRERHKSKSRGKDKVKSSYGKDDRDKKYSSRKDKDQGRDRSRSHRLKSKHRTRSRSYSYERDRNRRYGDSSRRDSGRHNRDRSERRGDGQPDDKDAISKIQQDTLIQLQQQQLQRHLLNQQLLSQQQQQNNLTGVAAMLANKKQRSVYIGNLTIGVVTDVMIRELFNAALANFVPDPITNPPVVNVAMDQSGRFGFVELRTEDLAHEGMKLDKIELCGRLVNVGRPKGYVEPSQAQNTALNSLNMAQLFASQLNQQPGSYPTEFLLLENICTVRTARSQDNRDDLKDEIFEETSKFGDIEKIFVPKPPSSMYDHKPARAYIHFFTLEDSRHCRELMQGRQLDDMILTAFFVSREEFERAQNNEWLEEDFRQQQIQSVIQPLSNPERMLQELQHLNSLGLMGQLNIGQGASKEGWLKVRGIPHQCTKKDVIEFFKGCGNLSEQSIRMVLHQDGRPTGEAFIEFKGPEANIQLAMSRDRKQIVPESNRYVEIFYSTQEEANRTPAGVIWV